MVASPIPSGKVAHGGAALVWKREIYNFGKPIDNIDRDRVGGTECNFLSLDIVRSTGCCAKAFCSL